MRIWLIIFGMAAVTYLPRMLPLTFIKEEALPRWARRGLNYVPLAVLSAIVGPAFLPSETFLHFVIDERLLAGVVAIGVAWLSKSTLLTILAGMLVLVALG